MDKFLNFLMVGLGGAAGSMLRYGATLLGTALHLSGNIATFAVNILGSFLSRHTPEPQGLISRPEYQRLAEDIPLKLDNLRIFMANR